MTDHSAMKLGRLKPAPGRKLLKLTDYLPAMVAPPRTTWRAQAAIGAWGVMLNDDLGDCTAAAPGHIVRLLSALAGAPFAPTDDDVLAFYKSISGYTGDPSTDNGALISDALAYWRTVGMAGRKIDGSASINPQDIGTIRLAISLFGAVDIGLDLPLSAQTQTVWTPDSSAQGVRGSWGGHCVPLIDYDHDGTFVCITWGEEKRLTAEFLLAYADEVEAPIDPEFIGLSGLTRSGLDLARMRADAAQLAQAA
ncbi:MAG: hypothetical protein ACREFC_12500 [Stellaceae bacterium]